MEPKYNTLIILLFTDIQFKTRGFHTQIKSIQNIIWCSYDNILVVDIIVHLFTIYIEQPLLYQLFCTDVWIIVLVGLAVGFVVCTVVIVLVCRRKRSTGTVLRTSGVPHTRLVNCPGKALVTLISRHNKMSENNWLFIFYTNNKMLSLRHHVGMKVATISEKINNLR